MAVYIDDGNVLAFPGGQKVKVEVKPKKRTRPGNAATVAALRSSRRALSDRFDLLAEANQEAYGDHAAEAYLKLRIADDEFRRDPTIKAGDDLCTEVAFMMLLCRHLVNTSPENAGRHQSPEMVYIEGEKPCALLMQHARKFDLCLKAGHAEAVDKIDRARFLDEGHLNFALCTMSNFCHHGEAIALAGSIRAHLYPTFDPPLDVASPSTMTLGRMLREQTRLNCLPK